MRTFIEQKKMTFFMKQQNSLHTQAEVFGLIFMLLITQIIVLIQYSVFFSDFVNFERI